MDCRRVTSKRKKLAARECENPDTTERQVIEESEPELEIGVASESDRQDTDSVICRALGGQRDPIVAVITKRGRGRIPGPKKNLNHSIVMTPSP